MKTRLAVLFLSLSVCAFSAAAQTVIENETSLRVNKTTVDVRLAIESRTRVTIPASLALLDTDGAQRANAEQRISAAPGRKTYSMSIPVGDLMEKAGDDLAWWRLSYTAGDSRGIVSLSELIRDDFDLRASAFQRVIPGEALRVRVRSLNPFTDRAVKGVAIDAELTLSLDTDAEEDELVLRSKSRTNGDGFAIIDFKIPPDIKLDMEPEIKIVGRKNGIVREIEEDLDEEEFEGTAILTSDKPLYQPGQTFNVRALLLDPNNTVVPNYDLEFSIEDENDTVVFRQRVTTSHFGIAAIAWPIPDNAGLGTYRVIVDAEDDLREDQLSFKVSRYDLPNFAVTTKPDKSYYLPNDTEARIDVTADYLFGKPVTKGKVRVVRESERKWNYREQKYDVVEGDVVEGATDESGKFIARFDLSKDQLELKDRGWRRYEDLSFAAYYTDLTTNRTEQRRFDIRLTKEPIHIYLIRHAAQHPEMPLTAYLSTFYADGTPAECNVEIRDLNETVAEIRTNALGAGKFEFDIPQENLSGSQYEIRITAKDKRGQIGTFDESLYLEDDEDALQIRTDKAIYKPGETIALDLISTQRTGYVYVDIVKDWTPVDSRVVQLRGGKVQIAIPYRPSFKGELMIAAYSDKDQGRWSESMRALRGVVFPEPQNLFINAKFSKEEYKPAEDATVRFTVLDGAKRPVESAIGLGIFDKAIEERARTDAEFSAGYLGRFFNLMGYHRSFGNISLKDLNDLDTTRPITPEMQLAAEVMLAGGWYMPAIYHSGNHDTDARSLYADLTKKQIKPVADALEARFAKDGEHPTDQASFDALVTAAGIDLTKLRDPWHQPFRAAFGTQRTQNFVTISTQGPDKKPDTADDFTVWTTGFSYFTRTGNAIDNAVREYNARTGGYIRDLERLRSELKRSGIDESRLKDMWGRDYRIDFEVRGRLYVIVFTSHGPNGYRESGYSGDDFEVWRSVIDYFGESEREINRVLSNEVNSRKNRFPRSDAEFVETLKRGGLDLRSVMDGHGRPVYVIGVLESRYTDKTTVEDGKQTTTPVTQQMMIFTIRSMGADVNTGADDADLATFSGAITEAHKGTGFAKSEVKTVVYSGAKGAISGTITDANGAAIPDVEVIATNEKDESLKFTARTNDEGKFLIANLPSGIYTLSVPAVAGFKGYVQKNLNVRSQAMLEANITLEAGTVSEMVDVTAAAGVDQTSNATATNVTTVTSTKFNINMPAQESSTPRVREYFPETLVWNPELLTDKRGRAEMKFKMADNITTWKMFAIASNKKGKVGVVEKEITAFQSFFVDLDPPKFLTEGDEIFLPTQVRNYSERKQRVDVTMDPGDWFAFLEENGGKQRIDVASGASQNAVFGFKALTPTKAGKQRVTAIGQSDSDAIEKPVTVRPNGEEIVQTESKVFEASAKFDINFPANALPGTPRAALKIYPNLFSHVAESVEGMLQRPYGCGEQTISSTYPNLMILKFVKNDEALREKAGKYLRKGYERLIGYQVADGGFTYWGGRDLSDVALTAYALRFLNDAKGVIEVDPAVIKRAEDWLISQQRADGSWTKIHRWESTADPTRTKLITTYVSRTLAMNRATTAAKPTNGPTQNDPLSRALAYLKTRNGEIDEPYAMALFGLASLDAGDAETAKQIASQLEKMAIPEGSAVYWKLETNTPFYGWGTAGRVETTALVLQLLTRVAKLEGRSFGENVAKGLMFLFRNKDRYGVWHSTQTTINVLDTFLAMLANGSTSGSQTIRIAVNGVELPEMSVPTDQIVPIDIDLNGRLAAGSNSVEVRTSTGSAVMAQTVATHYIDWRDSRSTRVDVGASRALRLDYKCNRSSAAIMDEISCSVEAERIGSRGYGMLLAELGTPPGADVSRESLEKALEDDWSLSKYEVLPDRIVLYMWSKAGGSKFNFKFRPRYGINAQTPASVVYDYYNPEAHATVAPMRFAVN